MIDTIIGIVLLVIGGFFVYIGIHMSEEKRQGKHIPLPWEK